ncbi:MAG: copper amine oxidase N-terminal domain-containing protein [Tissierellia bacterium]|nr:copper amine oxidase N-terminal domain-containing protein [Tissierellia bacterium]
MKKQKNIGKLALVVLALLLILPSFGKVFAEANDKVPSLYYDHGIYWLKEKDGTMYFPLRVVMESMGYDVEWKENQEVFVKNDKTELILKIGENKLLNKDLTLEKSPLLLKDREQWKTYAPLEFFEILDVKFEKITDDGQDLYIIGGIDEFEEVRKHKNLGIPNEVTRITKKNDEKTYTTIENVLKFAGINDLEKVNIFKYYQFPEDSSYLIALKSNRVDSDSKELNILLAGNLNIGKEKSNLENFGIQDIDAQEFDLKEKNISEEEALKIAKEFSKVLLNNDNTPTLKGTTSNKISKEAYLIDLGDNRSITIDKQYGIVIEMN